MTTIEQIRTKVREFQVRTNFGRSDEDNFTPWWLQQKFKLSDEEAAMFCSDGNFDFGLDGFHIRETSEKTVLSLIQAKFTEDINQIKKGVTDINRFIPNLSKIFKGHESDNLKENIVIKRIRPRIEKIEISHTKLLEIDAYVICLSNLGSEFIENKSNTNRTELFKTFEKEIDNPNIALTLKIIGLDSLIENNTSDVWRPARPFEIHFNGSDEIHMNESIFLSGLGKLSDLVELYERKGNQLFDKNVRLFLYGKKNESKGPAGKIKETLDLINSGKYSAEKFAFLHNGVTIYTTKINHRKEDKVIDITNPSILNGCQTIKSSFFFFQEANSKGKLNPETWKNIPISIRIVATTNSDLWREVAEANNRQNSMKASALRANDEIQIKLENDFKDMKIFYERQEEAFENISRSDYDQIEELFPNSVREPISIESIAQTIVCASDLNLSYASRQNEIFESHKLYLKVFSSKHLLNLKFLVFAHNVRRVIDLAINKAIPENTKKYAGFKGNKYRDLFTRLFLKIILKNKWFGMIDEYSVEVISRKGTLAKNLIEELRVVIKSQDNPILRLAGDIYWDNENVTWIKQDNQELYNIITNKLRLANIDIFEKVAHI